MKTKSRPQPSLKWIERPPALPLLRATIVVLISGCPDPEAAREQQAREAPHQRELRMTQQTVPATATTQALL